MGDAKLSLKEGKEIIKNGNNIVYNLPEDSDKETFTLISEQKFPCKKDYYPRNGNTNEAKQVFYDAGKFIIKKQRNSDGTFVGDAKVYTQATIDLAKLLLEKEVITLGEKPRQQSSMIVLENAYCWYEKNKDADEKIQYCDKVWMDTTKLTNSLMEFMKLVDPILRMYFPPERIDAFVGPANTGIEIAQAFKIYYEPLLNEEKRKGFVKRNGNPEELDSILKSGDRILVVDDALNTSETMQWAYEQIDNKASKKERKVQGYFVMIDLMRRKGSRFVKDILRDPDNTGEIVVPGQSAIQIADLVDILYVRNSLVKEGERNKYAENVINDVKKHLEEHYLTAKCNFEEKYTTANS